MHANSIQYNIYYGCRDNAYESLRVREEKGNLDSQTDMRCPGNKENGTRQFRFCRMLFTDGTAGGGVGKIPVANFLSGNKDL
jgi:hypothetical protein